MITLAHFEMGTEIPKLIHQTYPDKNKLTPELHENIRNICQMNPNWIYQLYDDKDIETTILRYYNQEILNIYYRINPIYGAARADFFRYLLIYALGGVYLDIKSTTTQPLDENILSDDRFIISHWNQ